MWLTFYNNSNGTVYWASTLAQIIGSINIIQVIAELAYFRIYLDKGINLEQRIK